MTRWMVLLPSGASVVFEDEPTLELMQAAVGGDLEAVPSPVGGVSVFVNMTKQDGSGEPLPLNPKATAFLREKLWPGQRIVGPMILAGSPDPIDSEGNLTDLSEEQVASLQEKLG